MRSSKWIVRYGYIKCEILWTHKMVILSHVNNGDHIVISTKGFSSIAKGFLKRWANFIISKNYRKYTN